MRIRRSALFFTGIIAVITVGCTREAVEPNRVQSVAREFETDEEEVPGMDKQEVIVEGTESYRGFRIDQILHSEKDGTIHYNIYIPESYDSSRSYALFITLPGWEGLYFQGVAENLKWEDYGFEAQKYNREMIIVAPQLNDWGETSANQTIALTEYLLSHYKIDERKVYLQGLSGGGETGSIVMEKRPDLYCAYLGVSSQWDGKPEALVKAEIPIYLVIGEKDSYYGSDSFREIYKAIYHLYKQKGLTDEKINQLLVLDVKEQKYFSQNGYSDQHAGGLSIAHDEEIMGWLFSH